LYWTLEGGLSLGSPENAILLVIRLVAEEQLLKIAGSLQFGSDNHAGIDGCLHRISALRNREGDIVGLTLRVGRFVAGNATMLSDLLYGSDTSILFIGAPGTGKTSIVGDVARLLAKRNSIIVVDTSCEIGGAGNVPHDCIGLARRMQVEQIDVQAKAMVEAVQNHTPSCMIIDEIGRRDEVRAALTCKERGVRIIASAHGSLAGLVRNTDLCDLVGGVDVVTIGDGLAKQDARGIGGDTPGKVSKLRSQRKRPPVFDVVIELQKGKLNEWNVVFSCGSAVDSILLNGTYSAQIRRREDSEESFIYLRHVIVSEQENGEKIVTDVVKKQILTDSPSTTDNNDSARKVDGVHHEGIFAGAKQSSEMDQSRQHHGLTPTPEGTVLEEENVDTTETSELDRSQHYGSPSYKESGNTCPMCSTEFVDRAAMLMHLSNKKECKSKLDEGTLEDVKDQYLQECHRLTPSRAKKKAESTCPACGKTFVHRRAMLEHALKKASCERKLGEAPKTAFHNEFLKI